MNVKDKILLKNTLLAIADQIVSSIPGLNLPWILSKALFGAGLELRQKRALEWVEMIRDNLSILTKSILQDEQFQDGFVFMLEGYLRERSEEKRKIAKKIFLDFAISKDKNSFTLERFNHILTQLSEQDIKVMRDIDWRRFVGYSSPNLIEKNYHIYGDTTKNIESIYSLINLGILIDQTGNRIGGPRAAPFVSLSLFGVEFRKFILD